MPYPFLFLIGLALGSFINVLSLRYDPEGRVFSRAVFGGRSRCPKCGRNLEWFELIPIFSYLFLRGRCRTCREGISFQYPLVEFSAGIITLFTAYFFNGFFQPPHLIGFYIFTAVWILIFLALLLITIIDIRHYLVPDELNLLLGVLGLGAFLIKLTAGSWLPPHEAFFTKNYAMIFQIFPGVFVNHIIGAFSGALFFLALVLGSKGKAMGLGDVKLAFALGLALGWPDMALALIFCFISGSVWSLGAIIARKKGMKSLIPFAPFLALGALLVVFLGYPALQGYFSLFGLI